MNEASRAPLRSPQWFGRQDRDGFAYRSWLKALGIPNDQFEGRPVIGICNTFSELTPCNSHIRVLAEQVKMGVLEAGGCAAACGRHTAQAPGPLAPGGRLWLRSRLGGERPGQSALEAERQAQRWAQAWSTSPPLPL